MPGENSGEGRFIPTTKAVTKGEDWNSYRAGERGDPAPIKAKETPKVIPNSQTNAKDWVATREGEREDPVKVPVKVPEMIQGPFSGNPEIIFTPIVTAVPINLPPPPPPPPTTYKVKIANPEVILFDDETLPATTLIDILFEDIGGQELLSMSRHDIISGDYVPNQLIKNLTSLNQEFSSKRLLSLQNTSDKYFSNFGIKLESKIPFVGGGANGENVYLNDSQDIVIDLINLDIDEQVEVQLSISGTIYTIVLEAGES